MTTAPLDMDLSTVDASRPIIKEGKYEVRVAKAELKPTAKNPQVSAISLDLDTITPASNRDPSQGQVGPGHKLYDTVMAGKSGKMTDQQLAQGLGSLVQSASFPPGQARLNNVEQWVPLLVGKVLKVEVGYEPASGTYKEKNVISQYLTPMGNVPRGKGQ